VERLERERLQALMVRLADGDRAAFAPLHATVGPLVRRFAARALAGSADADDAAQVALLKIFSRASEFDAERDALAWVLGVVAFECRTFRQRRRRMRESAVTVVPDVASDAPDPETLAIERDLGEAAEQVLGTLRPMDIETLRLAAAGCRPAHPSATFRKRLERALARFRAAWSSKHGVE
jgi:RNA polymerase sigma-70 factor (ECF subfamily)